MDRLFQINQPNYAERAFDDFCRKQYSASSTSMPYDEWLPQNIDEIEEAWWIVIQDTKMYQLNQK